ncbi:MAG: hypothetical protein U0S36_10485 [Candidatus Nanopelagicales bacterium]
MSQPDGEAAPFAQLREIMRELELDGSVRDVQVLEPHRGLLDITFHIRDEAMLVEMASGDQDVRVVGSRRECVRPVNELAAVLRDWVDFRRGWHT